jgi:hypothetical protein
MTSQERIREIVRQFPENGLKQVLTNPGNTRDLLGLAGAPMLPRIDLATMKVDPTTYATAEYRHVSSDLVLSAPLRPARKGGRRKRMLLTILIELQMQPDRVMLLRVLEYLVQIWKNQVKQHGQKYGSLANVKLSPVLPVVFHTGAYTWEKIGTLLDLMDDAADFHEVTPDFKPLFVSLPDLAQTKLEEDGGYFGQVLALLKDRKGARSVFAERLGQTVTKLQELKGEQRLRRLELLSYVEALVYHSRQTGEHEVLRQRIDAAPRDDEDRLEVDMARKTLADVHREEGRLQGEIAEDKRMLLEQLRLRWSPLPVGIELDIEATQDIKRLRDWLRRVATGTDLYSIGIVGPR